MNKTKPKVRKVKAWSVIIKSKIDVVGASLGCQHCDGTTDVLAIFKSVNDARAFAWGETNIVPVTITYTLPKPSKKKTK